VHPRLSRLRRFRLDPVKVDWALAALLSVGSSPKVVRIRTRVSGWARTIRRVASIPSSTGMRMSMAPEASHARQAAATVSSA